MPKPGQANSASPHPLINIKSHNAHIQAFHCSPGDGIHFATETPGSLKCQATHSKTQVQRLKNGPMTCCCVSFKLVVEGLRWVLCWLVPLVGDVLQETCKWSQPLLIFLYVVSVVCICVCSCVRVVSTHHTCMWRSKEQPMVLVPVFHLVWARVSHYSQLGQKFLSLFSHRKWADIMGPSYLLQLLHGFKGSSRLYGRQVLYSLTQLPRPLWWSS